MTPSTPAPRSAEAGFSLLELLIAMTLLTVVMGATLGGLSDIMKGNETVMMISSANSTLRGGMDIMVRDLLQAGSGLPASHGVSIPSGAGSSAVRLPGPPGTAFVTANTDLMLPAVMPHARQGPTVDGVQTDVIGMLMADNAFLNVGLSGVTDTSATIAAGPTLDTGPDRVTAGQLMMIQKGSFSTLVQVTSVDYSSRLLRFDDGDSLNLNQSGAAAGSLAALNGEAPINSAAATMISRVRLITYYIDNTLNAERPRLVRRVNNGDPMTFDNTLGTAVAFDVPDLQLTYDINNGDTNPAGVEMLQADLDGSGACSPDPCGPTLVRKVNVEATARSMNRLPPSNHFFTNTLKSQVSLRGMTFVDRYR
ncbi:MAG: prepilin-type N-terminal cleavage/methylation domain-containing protein [Vicinamibacterales bacterium]